MNGHRPIVRMRHHSPDAALRTRGSGLFALFNEMGIIFLIIAEVTFSAGDFPLFLGPSASASLLMLRELDIGRRVPA